MRRNRRKAAASAERAKARQVRVRSTTARARRCLRRQASLARPLQEAGPRRHEGHRCPAHGRRAA
eukprot:8400893-Alexandrium_andersonii.AAC.1